MNIYLIRHGAKEDDDKNMDTSNLTMEGRIQAKLVGKRLKEYGIQRIYCSTMVRALQTAEEINTYTQVEIMPRAGIKEMCMGDWDLKGKAYVEKVHAEYMKKFYLYKEDLPWPPNGETGQEVWERAKVILDEISQSSLEEVAVVTHGGVIRSVICGLLEAPQYKRFMIGQKLENCSITWIKYNSKTKQYMIHTINEHTHLKV